VQRRGWHCLSSACAGTAAAGAEELRGAGGAEGRLRAAAGDGSGGGSGGAGGEADEELRATSAATPVQVLLATHEGGRRGCEACELSHSLSLSLALLQLAMPLLGACSLGCAGPLDAVAGGEGNN